MIVGGASATAVTAHHQSVADGVRADAETWWYGEKFAEYVVVAAVEQTVAGTNYTFKIRIGSGQGILLRVFEGLDGKSSVHGLEKVAIDVAPRMIQESTDANGVVTPTATAQVGLLSLDEFTHEVYSVGRSGCSSVELGDKWPCASVYAWACDTHNWWRFPVVGTVARGWG